MGDLGRGERIFVEEQFGKDRAEYGAYLIKNLARTIEPEFGSGFSYRQLAYCRQYNVSIKSIPSYKVFSLRRVVLDYYAEGLLWKEMSDFADKNYIPISNDTFTIYHDIDYKENNVDIEICAPVTKLGEDTGGFTYRTVEPVPIMACTMVYGPFENIAGAYFTFADWLGTHSQYKMAGQSRQIVHRGMWNEDNPNKYLTEIQIPLTKL